MLGNYRVASQILTSQVVLTEHCKLVGRLVGRFEIRSLLALNFFNVICFWSQQFNVCYEFRDCMAL
jgi:hypothetical protein